MPCATHSKETGRPSRQDRGYDADYDAALRSPAYLAATHCACGRKFTKWNPKTGGHVKPVRAGGTAADGVVAECRKCNLGWRRDGV